MPETIQIGAIADLITEARRYFAEHPTMEYLLAEDDGTVRSVVEFGANGHSGLLLMHRSERAVWVTESIESAMESLAS